MDSTNWTDRIDQKLQQDWIGKSVGAEVDFVIATEGTENNPLPWGTPLTGGESLRQKIRVFTTRPDTLFGATYMVMAPEHKLVDEITTPEYKDAVKRYRDEAARKSDMDRTDMSRTRPASSPRLRDQSGQRRKNPHLDQ